MQHLDGIEVVEDCVARVAPGRARGPDDERVGLFSTEPFASVGAVDFVFVTRDSVIRGEAVVHSSRAVNHVPSRAQHSRRYTRLQPEAADIDEQACVGGLGDEKHDFVCRQ